MLDQVLNLQTGPRFALHRGLKWVPPIMDAFYSKYLRELVKLTASGSLRVTTQASRPDLLSYDIYGDVQLWSVIMFYNKKISPYEIIEGETIQYPSLADLENLYFTLSAQQKQIEKSLS